MATAPGAIVDAAVAAIAAALVVVGGTALASPVKSIRRVVTSRQKSPVTFGSGPAAVTGRAVEAGRPVTAPLSNEPCLGYVVEQQLRYQSGASAVDFRRRWRRSAVTAEFRTFELEYGDGGALDVEPVLGTDARPAPIPDDWLENTHLRQTAREERTAYDGIPSALVGDFDSPRPDDEADIWDREIPHRYVEWRLDPGTPVLVSGSVTEDGPDRLRHRLGIDLLLDLRARSLGRFALGQAIRAGVAAGVVALGVALALWVTGVV